MIGDEIIETPMAWPCRYFEAHSYRTIVKDYFRRGARWTAAPRPQLRDALFEADYRIHEIESRSRTPMHIDTTFLSGGAGRFSRTSTETAGVRRRPAAAAAQARGSSTAPGGG